MEAELSLKTWAKKGDGETFLRVDFCRSVTDPYGHIMMPHCKRFII